VCKGDALELVAAFEGLDTRTQFPAVLARAAQIAGVRPDSDPGELARIRAEHQAAREARDLTCSWPARPKAPHDTLSAGPGDSPPLIVRAAGALPYEPRPRNPPQARAMTSNRSSGSLAAPTSPTSAAIWARSTSSRAGARSGPGAAAGSA